MFVAAPGLIRSIWRLDRWTPAAPAERPPRRDRRSARHPMTRHDRRDAPPSRSVAAEADARRRAAPPVRGIAFAVVLGCSRSTSRCQLRRRRDSRSGSTSRAATALDLQTTVGVLWVVAGARHRRRRRVAARARAGVPVAAAAAASSSCRGSRRCSPPSSAGKPANLTGMIAGSLALAAPDHARRVRRHPVRAQRMLNIALEGKILVGACVASVAASVGCSARTDANALVGVLVGIGVGDARRRRPRRASCSPGSASAGRVDQIIAGIVINIGAVGITNFLFLRVLTQEHRAQHAADRRGRAASRCWPTSR